MTIIKGNDSRAMAMKEAMLDAMVIKGRELKLLPEDNVVILLGAIALVLGLVFAMAGQEEAERLEALLHAFWNDAPMEA